MYCSGRLPLHDGFLSTPWTFWSLALSLKEIISPTNFSTEKNKKQINKDDIFNIAKGTAEIESLKDCTIHDS